MRKRTELRMNGGIKALAVLALALAIATPAIMSAPPEAEALDATAVEFKAYFNNNITNTIDVKAGESRTVEVVAWNMTASTLPYIVWVKLDDVRLEGSGDDMSYSVLGERTAQLDPSPTSELNSHQFQVAINVNEYSPGGTYQLKFSFIMMNSPDDPTSAVGKEFVITMNVISESVPGSNYGKVMGIMSLGFDPLVSAAVSLAIWVGIALLLLLAVRPVLKRVSGKYGNERRVGRIGTVIAGTVLTYGVAQCIYIGFRDLFILNMASRISLVLYILFAAILIWDFYTTLMNAYARKRGFAEDSLAPLGIAIGKILIVVLATGYMLTMLGVDWTYVMTTMGILGLVLGIGAQSTLAQFFSGLSILGTRPFKAGDLIRMNESPDVLRVIDVGFMVTKFKNWSNSEIFTIPNDRVVSATIVNVTKGTKYYRVSVVVGIEYGSDVAKAKELVLAAAKEHPHVINDGRVEMPTVRLSDFADSSLNLTLLAYIDDFENNYIYAGELREAIYRKFGENGIAIAYPHIDVTLVGKE